MSYNSVNAQITADFTPTSAICSSATVKFTASITGSYARSNLYFVWDFGDTKPPQTSQTDTISYSFPVTPGAFHLDSGTESPFKVKLTVYDKTTNAQLDTITHPVTVRPAPIPALSDAINPRKPFDNCANATQSPIYTVTVNNQTQGTTTIPGYKIDWGDGVTDNSVAGTDFPKSHTYTQFGLFKLKFTSIGINGCESSVTYTVKNQGIPLIGISGGNTSGCAPVTFSFNAINTSANDPSTTYVWDFGDGTTRNWTTDSITATGGKVSHTYTTSSCSSTNSFYIVKITATNACQSAVGAYSPVRVGTKPRPSFIASNLCEGEAVIFQNTTQPGSNFDCSQSVYYRWDFGDGSQTTSTTNNNVTHTFPLGNNFDVRLIAVNDCLDSASVTQRITLITRPVANATLSPLQGCAPTPLTVTATDASTGDITARTWSVSLASGWTWGPGSNSSSVNPVFIFTTKGNYVITLQVSNSCAINKKTFNVFMNGPINVTFPAISDQCTAYIFDATNTSVFRVTTITNEVVQANWQITQNSGFHYLNGTTAQSNNPKIQFDTEGPYTIAVTLDNGCGTVTKTQTLNIRPPVQLITTISDTAGCAPKTISFTDASTGLQLTHRWTIQLPTGVTYVTGSSTSASPSMQFTLAGVYTITHTLTGLCSTTQTKTFTVSISKPPTINLAPIANKCTAPFNLMIDSTNFSINQNGKTLTNIQWSTTPAIGVTFIDGTNLNNKYPHFSFSNTGQYTVTVATQNDCGPATESQTFWIPAKAVEQSTSTALTSCRLPFKVDFTDHSQGDQLVHSWSVTSATGYTITPSAAAASPEIVFNTVGIYTVTHTITNSCGPDSRTYTVKAKDAPSVTLDLQLSACNTYKYVANPQNMKLIANLNDTISYLWTITPFRAITYLSGTSDTSHYPIIQFADTGVFKITVRTLGECGFTETYQTIGITKGPEIMLKDSHSDQCLSSDLTFTGTVYGQNLVYNWTINPIAGAAFVNATTSTSPLPQIRFSIPGDYSVSLNVRNDCSNDIKQWNYKIIDKPTIVFSKVADTCDNFTFKAERYVVVQDNGNAISSYNWTVTPSTGFNYVDGTTATSPLPHIAFTAANPYKVTMNATNGCGTTSISRSFTIDQFVQVEAGADTTICTFNTLFALKGTPAGGSWSILPTSASSVLKLIGSTYYLDLNVPGNYTLTYTRGNSYCASQDIRHFNILALPMVDAGKDFTLCENDKSPYQLTGTPAGGTWSGSGISGNTFLTTGLTSGSYILKYTWTDPATTCANTDQLVAKLLPVAVTGFIMLAESCKDLPVLFTPNGSAGTIFNWDFGDGQTAITSGSINHTYRTGGLFTVKMISADPNNCTITTIKKIVILDDIALPVVTVSPNRGCGPLSVTITVDTTGTTGNGQRYSWNLGNGQVVNVPFTKKDIIYNQGINDTTYNVTLTITNNCFSKSVIYPIMVNALPNANFALPHPWECSPKIVSIKNLSQDRAASFHWDFGDGTTSTAYEPTHSFSTGKVATIFMIKLVAENKCGKDSITRPLLIKPNSIEAFIQMNTRTACPGEIVAFTNFSSDTVLQIMNYYWDFGDGTIANTWDATHAYAAQGRYTIKLFVDNGCSYAEKTDTILIYPPLTLTITSRDSVCVGENLYMEGKSPLGTLINTKWDFGDGYFGTNSATNHVFLTPGWMNVTFSAATGSNLSHCPGSIIKRIYVKALPPAAPVNDIEGCSPIILNLTPAGKEPQLWNFGEDSVWTSSGKYTYHNDYIDNKPIRRKVSTVTENTMGCRSYSFFWVTIYPVPKAKIRVYSAGGSPENVFLTSISTNTTACEWLFPDGSSAQGCDSVLVKFYNNGFYKIQLRSSNQYGCADTTSIMHETIIKGLFVPNAFKPSDLNPEVNTFKPVGIGLKSYYMGIYDTWDNLIWETTQLIDTKPAVGWDGSSVKGKNLPMDVYIWRVKAVFIDGTEWKGMKGRDGILRTEGTVTLIK